jgi:hypothetical protein
MKCQQILFRSLMIPAALIGALTMLSGCGGGSSAPSTGIVSFDITDAPVDDINRVQITINRIDLKPANGATVSYQPETPIIIENLLDLQGTHAATLLPDMEVPAGQYNWLRLHIDGGFPDSFVVTHEGGSVDLFVPGQQSGMQTNSRHIQLVSGFVVPAGGRADFTLDVDLRRALTKPAGTDHYLLRPALRLTDNTTTGSISGIVDDALVMTDDCTNDIANDRGVAVYLYQGNDAITGDVWIDEQGEPIGNNNPITTANVSMAIDTGLFSYSIGFVTAGDYTVALTCQALDDMPDESNAILFSQSVNVSVVAGQDTTADFAASP